MRQVSVLALAIALCLTFSACSRQSDSDDKAQEITAHYAAVENIVMTMCVTADYGERVYEFRLKYTGTLDAGEIEILSPESVAGVKAVFSSDGSTLNYDGAELDTGDLTADGLSPVGVVPVMLGQMKDGLVSSSYHEKLNGEDVVSLEFDVTDTVTLKASFGEDSLLPVTAEVLSDGYTVINCTFENVSAE